MHGLVQTLRDVGFVDQDPDSGLYAVGAGLLQLGATSLDHNELRSRALNWTDALAARTGLAVLLGTLEGDRVVVVHHVFRPDGSAQALADRHDRSRCTRTRSARCCWRTTRARCAAAPARGAREPHLPDHHRLGRRCGASSPTSATTGWAAEVEEARAGRGRRWRPRSATASGYVVAAVGVVGPPTGCATPACDRGRRW